MKTIYFATGNKNKLEEARRILKGYDVQQIDVNVPELQGKAEYIAREKVRTACQMTGKIIFTDDTSLECDALGGLPGPYIKDFIDRMGPDGIYKMLLPFNNFRATAMACIGYCEPAKEPVVLKGIVHGKIFSPRGNSGFKFDTIFSPDGDDRTFAEMSDEEKNEYSHRRRGLDELLKYLQS